MVEVLIATAIIAIAIVPIMELIQSNRVKSEFNEYYLFAHIRAQRILDVVATQPYEKISSLSLSDQKENLVKSATSGPVFPPEYARKLDKKGYSESWWFNELKTGVGIVEVEIHWKFTGPKQDWRTYNLTRLVYQGNLSLLDDSPLTK